MTILVAHNRYRNRGGEDSVFESECRMLEEAGHKVVRYEKANADIHDGGGLAAKISLAVRTVWNQRTFREVRELIRREKPDVVHCHNTFPLISPSIYYAAAREGVPVVQTLHNYRLTCLNGYLYRGGRICESCLGRSPLRGVCRRCYRGSFLQSATTSAMLLVHRALGTWRRKVTRYIALTEFAREKFIQAGLPADKIVVKPNAFLPVRPAETGLKSQVACLMSPYAGLAPQILDRSFDKRRATSEGAPAVSVVYLGRLSPEKGVDVLLRAWALLSNGASLDSCTLSVIGSGPEEDALRTLASSLGIASSVRFLGSLSREKALFELASSDLLVFPSLWYETFGLTILEAASQGVPALVTNIGSQSLLVNDNVTGRFFPAGDPAALAAAIRSLLADSAALRRMGEAARAAFETSDCRPDRNLARLLSIYASCGAPH